MAISGQQHIPVVLYGDGSFQVEPSAVDIKNKLQELGELTDWGSVQELHGMHVRLLMNVG